MARARTLMVCLWLGLLAGAAATPASAEPARDEPAYQSRIVNGQLATRDYPFMAQVTVVIDTPEGRGPALCGGTVVARRYVVTAGHCMTDDNGVPPSDVTVRTGSRRRDQGTPHAVADIRVHPQFSEGAQGELRNDVAVLQLATPVDGVHARLLKPGRDDSQAAPGVNATVLGWGRTCESTCSVSDDLREAVIPIRTDAECASAWTSGSSTVFEGASMFCAGDPRQTPVRDTCQGDSGGPLAVPDGGDRFALAGVTSFGEGCARSRPGMYARVFGQSLGSWLRAPDGGRVPQADFDVSPPQPQVDREVTFTSQSSNPSAPYTELLWDLDGDGQFNDASGPVAKRAYGPGTHTVVLQAASPAGDREVRRHSFDIVARSPLSFAGPALTVTEGQIATLTLNKPGRGSGTAAIAVNGATATAGSDFDPASAPGSLPLADTEHVKSFTLATLDDTVDEPDETLRVELGALSGTLDRGDPPAVLVTVVDNDLPPKPVPPLKVLSARKSGSTAVKLRLRFPGPGLYDAALIGNGKGYRGLELGSRLGKTNGATTRTITLRLNRRARIVLRRKKRLAIKAQVFFDPPGRGEDDLELVERRFSVRR